MAELPNNEKLGINVLSISSPLKTKGGTNIEDRMSTWFKFEKEKENDRYPDGSNCRSQMLSLLTRQKHGRRSELPLLCMLIYVSMDYNPFSNFRLLSSILATAAS